MAPKRHGYGAAQPRSKGASSVAPTRGNVLPGAGRAVKRSITVRPELDAALREIAGGREYSQVANEAFVLYVQARGIEAVGRAIEVSSGPIPRAEEAEADRRLEDARRRAKQRRKRQR